MTSKSERPRREISQEISMSPLCNLFNKLPNFLLFNGVREEIVSSIQSSTFSWFCLANCVISYF